jgi:hypothetical protein
MLTFLKCPAYFEFRYLETQVEEPKAVNLFLGSAVHKIAEMAYEQKIATGKLPPVDEMLAAHDEIWKTAADEVAEQFTGDLKTSELLSRKMVKTYLTDRAPFVDPIEVESEWYYEPPGKEYYIHGIVDILAAYKPPAPITLTVGKKTLQEADLLQIFKNEPDNPVIQTATDEGIIHHQQTDTIRLRRVHDIKTVGRTPSMEPVGQGYSISPDYEFQLAWYASMLTEGKHGLAVCLDYITKTATPKCLEAASTISKHRCGALMKTIDLIHAAVGTGLFYPNRMSKFCGQGCDFWDKCHQKHG